LFWESFLIKLLGKEDMIELYLNSEFL
jgi:hypothetical protein